MDDDEWSFGQHNRVCVEDIIMLWSMMDISTLSFIYESLDISTYIDQEIQNLSFSSSLGLENVSDWNSENVNFRKQKKHQSST